MTMESEALKEINELKAQVNALIKTGNLLNVGLGYSDDIFANEYQGAWKRAKAKTPAQCLKQHDIALLNSLIAGFVKGSVPFEDVVASRLNSLELEK